MEIVVLGCRGFGQVHLRSIEGVDVSIMERDQEVAEKCKKNYEIRHVYSTVEEALNSGAEIVDIVLPHSLHRDVAVKAMKKGKHVLVEKPIATTVEESEEMIKTSEESRRKLMVGEQYFFDPSVNYVKGVISKGMMGDVKTIIVRDQRKYSRKSWRTDARVMGGGALIDGGIHYVDTVLNIGGNYSDLRSFTSKGNSSMEIEDTSLALFKFINGSAGFLFYSWGYESPPLVPGLEVIGTEGSLYEDVTSRSQEDFKDKSRDTAFGTIILNGRKQVYEKYDVFKREISMFLRSIREDIPVPFDPRLAQRDLKTVLEIYGKVNLQMNR